MGNGGRDYLAMQVLLRLHKGHNREIVPTWFPFVEEKLPLLCPISKLLAKALAEGVVDMPGYGTRAEPYFNTKLNMLAVHIPWKEGVLARTGVQENCQRCWRTHQVRRTPYGCDV